MSSILVIGEAEGTEIKNISQQVSAVAAGMGDVVGLVIGKNISDAEMKLATAKIILADDEKLEYYDPVKFSSVISQVVEQNSSTKILM